MHRVSNHPRLRCTNGPKELLYLHRETGVSSPMRGVSGADCDGRPFGADELLQVYREEGGGEEATERTRTAIRSPRGRWKQFARGPSLAERGGLSWTSNATRVEVAAQAGVQVVTRNRVEGGETPNEEIEP